MSNRYISHIQHTVNLVSRLPHLHVFGLWNKNWTAPNKPTQARGDPDNAIHVEMSFDVNSPNVGPANPHITIFNLNISNTFNVKHTQCCLFVYLLI